MKINRERKNKILHACIILFAVTFVLTGVLLLLELWDRGQGEFPEQVTEVTYFQYNGQEYEPKEGLETFLVMGLDKFEVVEEDTVAYNNDKQADFLLLMVFDNQAKTCTAIQINRDTMADVHVLGVDGSRIDTVTKQINLSHTYGNGRGVSCRNVANSVSSLLGDVSVDHYVSMTMDAIPILNDQVGGVTVEVLDDFTGVDDTLVKGQTVKLQGEQALRYIRSRKGLEDSSNVNRMKRQQQYIQALYEQLLDSMSQSEEFVVDTVLMVEKHIVSDRTPNQLQELAQKMRAYEFTGIRTLEGESVKGEQYMEFHVDEEATKAMVAELFYQLKD